ncbi:FecR family protein [Aquipseudomonas campi]
MTPDPIHAPLPADDAVREQAARWFSRRQDAAPSAQEQQHFDAWLDAAPQHREEYARLQQLWQVTGLLTEQRLRALSREPSPRRWRPALLATAASAVLAIGLVYLLDPLAWRGETYATRAGEHRQVTLADGSQLELGGRTRLTVRLHDQRRDVTLQEGEALFSVSRDPQRPFVVQAGAGTITVTGTRFDVRHQAGVVRVAVESGSVLVHGSQNAATRPLTAGDGVRVNSAGVVSAIQPIDIAAATAWRQGRLVFNDTPLVDVVAEVSRYREKPLLVAPAVAGLRFSSVFRANDTDALLSALPRVLPVRIETLADGSMKIIPF